MSAQETEDMYIIIVSCGLVAVCIQSSGYPCISKEKHICTFMDTCFRSSEDKVFLLYKTRAGVQDDVGILDLCNVHSMHQEMQESLAAVVFVVVVKFASSKCYLCKVY